MKAIMKQNYNLGKWNKIITGVNENNYETKLWLGKMKQNYNWGKWKKIWLGKIKTIMKQIITGEMK